MKVVVRSEAERDIGEAYGWYSAHAPEVATALLDAIGAALERLAEAPASFPLCHRDVRRLVMPRFPYVIYFRIRRDCAEVIGVMHGRRAPATWRCRT